MPTTYYYLHNSESRTRPPSSCTAPRIHDSDRTFLLPYGPAPIRLGSDRLGPALSRRASTILHGPGSLRHPTIMPVVRMSNRGPWSVGSPGVRPTCSADPGKHLLRASTSPSSPGHRQALRLPGLDKHLTCPSTQATNIHS